MVPVSQGGQHTFDNLITVCESHHIAHHEGALAITGTASTATFTPRARSSSSGTNPPAERAVVAAGGDAQSSPTRAPSSLAIAERLVETRLALKALGFDKHEVKTALDRARTHVGTTELPLAQWIKIALSYCPKPRT